MTAAIGVCHRVGIIRCQRSCGDVVQTAIGHLRGGGAQHQRTGAIFGESLLGPLVVQRSEYQATCPVAGAVGDIE
jgi:hypothetical protein